MSYDCFKILSVRCFLFICLMYRWSHFLLLNILLQQVQQTGKTIFRHRKIGVRNLLAKQIFPAGNRTLLDILTIKVQNCLESETHFGYKARRQENKCIVFENKMKCWIFVATGKLMFLN